MSRKITFLLKALAFGAPLALILGFPSWVLWRSGELLPNDVMVARQLADPATVIGLAFSNPVDYVSLHEIIAKHPQVLVLGSSRVGQIRANFFTATTSAYIASTPIQKIVNFRPFLDAIPASSTPAVLILGLDQKFFVDGSGTMVPDGIESRLQDEVPPFDVFSKWGMVYQDYYEKKFSITELMHPASTDIGMEAIAEGQGFRSDGSGDIGDHAPSPYDPTESDYHFASTLSLINDGIDGFERSDVVSPDTLVELNALLDECQARHIYVIGFIPAFAPTVYAKVASLPADDYGYMNTLTAVVGPLFTSRGFGFYNFTNPASIPITDADMQDGFHTTERGALDFFVKMAATDPVLMKYTDPGFLRAKLASTSAAYDVVNSGE